MSTSETLTSNESLIENNSFLKELVHQVRAMDTYEFYGKWSDERLLSPFIVTKAQKKEISLEGSIDPKTLSRIQWFFRAIAARIEQETGKMAQVSIDLNDEGFGLALAFSGRLLVVSRALRDAHRFGFVSFEKLAEEGEKLVQRGVELVQRFPEVCEV